MSELTRPFAQYVHTRRVGDLCFVAGQGCRDPLSDTYAGLEFDAQGNILRYDIRQQTSGVLRNIERALATEQLTADDIVDVTVFLKDMRDFNAMNEVWNSYWQGRLTPTRTTVAVKDLPGHNYVEMKAIAAKGRA